MVAVFGAMAGCGVDAIVFGEFTRGKQREVPGAGITEIAGTAPGLSGGTVAFATGKGKGLDALGTTVAPEGTFATQAPGSAEYTNLVVTVVSGGGEALGIVPRVDKKESVFDPDMRVDIGELGANSTFATLLVLAKAKGGLASLSTGAVAQALSEVVQKRDQGDPALKALSDMLGKLRAATSAPLRTFPEAGESYLATAALPFDYADDAAPEVDTSAFDAALDAALGAFEFHACYPSDRIRLVFIADMRAGGKNRNCIPNDPFKSAKDEPGKSVFLTGAIHKDSPRCGDTDSQCLDDAMTDEANRALGNWAPNVIAMYDDGTHGDAAADDGLWTLALDLPWFDPGNGPAVRIGYKYTYGHPAQGWSGSEEWPGNQRLLELRDVNHDHVITRQDLFGDETTNKDKANGLLPSHGGCSTVVFPGQDSPAICTNDAVEAEIDTDGDCVLDTWPAPGVAGPLTVDCPL